MAAKTSISQNNAGTSSAAHSNRPLRRKGREQIKEELLSNDPTRDYHTTRFNYFGELYVQELPLWRLWTGRLMLHSDPIVNFMLNVRNAALGALKVEIKAKRPEVQEWLQKQWDLIWDQHRPKVTSAKKWGFAPLQPRFKEKKDGLIHITGMKDFAPEDCRALEAGGRLVGHRVKGVRLYFPQAVWITFGSEFGSPYGYGCLRRAYPPWYEKWMARGAKKLLQLRMIKDAYIGDVYWYPPNMLCTLPDGTKMPWRDVMRELAENRVSGGAQVLPKLLDNNGKELTGYQPPVSVTGEAVVYNWVEHCDEGIFQGGDIPVEVVRAGEPGNSFSGRSIPFMVVLSVCTQEAVEIVQCIDEQVLRPTAWLNWGGDVEYEIKPRSLLETFAADAAGSPIGGSAIGGLPSQQLPAQMIPQGQPQQYSEQGQQYAEDEVHELAHIAAQHHGKGVVKVKGPLNIRAHRVGPLNDAGRGIFFGDSSESIKPYNVFHAGHQPKEHVLNVKHAIVAKHHAELHQHLFGKSLRDAVWHEDKKSGFKSSVEAHRRVEARMAKKVHSMGHDAIIYTQPPAPAKSEIAIVGKAAKELEASQHSEQYGEEGLSKSTQHAEVHAPKGGITIEGTFFRGGEFIPNQVLAKATPAQKEQIQRGLQVGKNEKTQRAKRGEMREVVRTTEETKTAKGKIKKVPKLHFKDGSQVPDHIPAGKIPPAWRDVFVSDDPDDDVWVVAKDGKGRLKMVYSDSYQMRQAAIKFARNMELIKKKNEVSDQIQKARGSSDPATREAAACMWLIEEQATRPGSDKDTKSKVKAFGATTLRAEHVLKTPEGVRLKFIGKEGIPHDHLIKNPELAKELLRRKRETKDGKLFDTTDAKLLQFAKTLDSGRFTPKDFRTLKATTMAIEEIKKIPAPKSDKEMKQAMMAVATKVSNVLGNRPAQAIESYINPMVWSAWSAV